MTGVGLRPLREEDLPRLHRWYQTPELWDHLVRGFSPRDEAEAVAYMRRWLAPSPTELRLGIEADGQLVGQAFFSPIDRAGGWAELHTMIGETGQRGRGVGRQAVALLLARGWALGLNRIVLKVLETNTAARRVYEGCGFRETGRDGTARKQGADVPVLVMEVARPAEQDEPTSRPR